MERLASPVCVREGTQTGHECGRHSALSVREPRTYVCMRRGRILFILHLRYESSAVALIDWACENVSQFVYRC